MAVVLLCDAVSDDSLDDNAAGDSDGGPRGSTQNQIAEGGAIEERCAEDASALSLAAGGADDKPDVVENCAFELTGAVGGCACHAAPASGDDGGVCRSASPPRATPVYLSALLCMHLHAPSSPSPNPPSLPPSSQLTPYSQGHHRRHRRAPAWPAADAQLHRRRLRASGRHMPRHRSAAHGTQRRAS